MRSSIRVASSLAVLLLLSGMPAAAIDPAPPRPVVGDRAAARRVDSDALDLAAAQRPNVVILLLDDVGAHDGRLWSRLPSISRRFLDEGIEFSDFHGETPTCCPGRVGFLTGLHTHAHGVTRNDGTLFRSAMSLVTQLQRQGYYTILGGKYLNGYPSVEPKVPPGWSEFHAMDAAYYGYPMWSNGHLRWYGHRPRDYSTDVISRKILGALERAPRGRPVFVWAAPFAAHMPRLPAPRYRDDPRCEGIPRWSPPGYMERDVSEKPAYVRRLPITRRTGIDFIMECRSLLAVDDLLRRVERKLAEDGRLDDTLFVLTADNGMNFGMHRLLRDKKTPYATQLPFFVSWPGRIDPDRAPIVERLQNIDLAPTICELVGCHLGPYPTGQRRPDGRSFAGLLLGNDRGPERGAVLGSFLTPGAKVPRWHGVETTADSPLASTGCAQAAARGCRWSYVRYETGEEELYDLSNGPCWEWQVGLPGDPCRLENLAGRPRYREIQAALRLRLAALRRQ